MPDRTIPFFNTIMKCSDFIPRNPEPPEGFSIVPYRYGYEKEWARLECSAGDFRSEKEAEGYFTETYLQNAELFPDILFVRNREHNVVGSCIAWQDTREVFCIRKALQTLICKA